MCQQSSHLKHSTKLFVNKFVITKCFVYNCNTKMFVDKIMKALVTILLVSFLTGFGPENGHDETKRILNAWIATQNEGTDAAVRNFIDTYYSPGLIERMKNYEDHVKFYKQIIHEFGKIQNVIYETEKDTDTKLKVQVLKEATPLVPEPGPEEILVIEIDLDPENKRYLSRGLGMGALVCYIKR